MPPDRVKTPGVSRKHADVGNHDSTGTLRAQSRS